MQAVSGFENVVTVGSDLNIEVLLQHSLSRQLAINTVFVLHLTLTEQRFGVTKYVFSSICWKLSVGPCMYFPLTLLRTFMRGAGEVLWEYDLTVLNLLFLSTNRETRFCPQ